MLFDQKVSLWEVFEVTERISKEHQSVGLQFALTLSPSFEVPCSLNLPYGFNGPDKYKKSFNYLKKQVL